MSDWVTNCMNVSPKRCFRFSAQVFPQFLVLVVDEARWRTAHETKLRVLEQSSSSIGPDGSPPNPKPVFDGQLKQYPDSKSDSIRGNTVSGGSSAKSCISNSWPDVAREDPSVFDQSSHPLCRTNLIFPRLHSLPPLEHLPSPSIIGLQTVWV